MSTIDIPAQGDDMTVDGFLVEDDVETRIQTDPVFRLEKALDQLFDLEPSHGNTVADDEFLGADETESSASDFQARRIRIHHLWPRVSVSHSQEHKFDVATREGTYWIYRAHGPYEQTDIFLRERGAKPSLIKLDEDQRKTAAANLADIVSGLRSNRFARAAEFVSKVFKNPSTIE